MDNYTYDLEPNNVICEATGCVNRATEKIEVGAGPQKVIYLLLCNRCVSKFSELDCPKSNAVLSTPISYNMEVNEGVS